MHPDVHTKLRGPVHFSTLKRIALSPSHYVTAAMGYNRTTLQMRMGSGAHALIFGEPYTVYVNEANKAAGKATVRNGKHWEAFKAAHPGYTIASESEHEKATAIAESVKRHRRAYSLLTQPGADRERTIQWEWCGRACRGTPDVIGSVLVDLKSTRSSQPDRFTRDAQFRHYHAQLAWYRIGCRANGRDPERCYIVAVENELPHPVTVFPVSERALDKGERLCRLWMERLALCERHNHWPGYIDENAEFEFDIPDIDELDWEGIEEEEETAA